MSEGNKKNVSRRQVMTTVAIGGVATAVMLPSKWTKPIVDSVITPAHAQSSPPPTTVTTGTTVTTTSGTTVTTTTPPPPP